VHHRQNKYVRRRLRIDIFNCDDLVVAEHLPRGDLTGNNPAKNAIPVARLHGYDFGLSSSKLIAVSGLGMYPPIDDLNAIGTVV